MEPAAAAVPSQLAQDVLETKTAILAIQKMIKTQSEATRQASSISRDDLDSLLVALRCVVIAVADDDVDEIVDTTEMTWQDNKYDPQQQKEYLETLRNEVSGSSTCILYARTGTSRLLLREGATFVDASWHLAHTFYVLRDRTDNCLLLTGHLAKPLILGIVGKR